MTKDTRKFIIYGIVIITWIGFWTYINQTTGNEKTDQTTQTSTKEKSPSQLALEKCQNVRAEGKKLDDARSEIVAEARTLQRVWIVNEMSTLRDEGKITTNEWKYFSSYLSNPLSESGLALLEVIDLMDKVVSSGYIKSYLPKNVVEVGSKIRLMKSSSDYYLDYPECFSDVENDLYKMISELPEIKDGWGRKLESPMDLIP